MPYFASCIIIHQTSECARKEGRKRKDSSNLKCQCPPNAVKTENNYLSKTKEPVLWK